MRALLSVSDKTGLVEFARELSALGFGLVSTGGTSRTLKAAALPITTVEEITGFPEILGGRVKTLHPAIHGGLLARRADPDHRRELAEHRIEPIDLVVVNLYPFVATIRQPDVTVDEAIEQIDIGGPAMLRAAAKNHQDVMVVTDPADYAAVLEDLRTGGMPPDRRRALAAKAFAHVSAYDAVVAEYLWDGDGGGSAWPSEIAISGRLAQGLRYGENPQQRAAAYRLHEVGAAPTSILDAVQLSGKELSFNNLLDTDAAWQATRPLGRPTVAIVKHTIPCGLATRDRLADAFDAALAGDPVSAFGGIVALNRPVDGETARRVAEARFDIVIAPEFGPEAELTLSRRRSLRLLQLTARETDLPRRQLDFRSIMGGLLVQDADDQPDNAATWRVVTRRSPTDAERMDLAYAWAAVRHVKSNAIVLVKEQAVVGVGSGQPNRVESVVIATKRAGERAAGAVLASDAFFPFADGIETAAAAGVTAIIQPGGSVRDAEGIAAADHAGVAMLFTGTRHFRH